MKFTAIICEFNPFTNGHKFIIEKAKELTGNPILCLMSGNFVQRGEPAITDKFTRAKHAILHGADIVIELPTIYATSSAQDFAYGAIKTLNKIEAVEYLVFGSECGDINELVKLAKNSQANVKEKLKDGTSFATASSKALGKNATPNNILAIEYLKALSLTNSNIIPLTIKRTNNYHDNTANNLASATALRNLIKNGEIEVLHQHSPKNTTCSSYTNYSEFYKLVEYNIKTSSLEHLNLINGVCEGLENRIVEAFNKNNSFNEAFNGIKTKRYPSNKIMRILTNSLLNITSKLVQECKREETSVYIKVLAVKNSSKETLSLLPKNLLVTNKASYKNLNIYQTKVIEKDLLASKIFSCINTAYLSTADFTTKI